MLPCAEAPAYPVGNVLADIVHIWCCDPDMGLCGTDISDEPAVENGIECAVCRDLEDHPCPSCGYCSPPEDTEMP